jgi:hypothetical protein
MHTIMLNFTGHYTTNIKRKKKPAAQDKVSNRVGGTKLDADLPKPNSLLGARALIEARSVVRVRHAPRPHRMCGWIHDLCSRVRPEY